jgi:excisionase family DNA binding protein
MGRQQGVDHRRRARRGGAVRKTDANRLVDLPAVADQLGVTDRYVRRLVAERRIPYIKFGRLLRFDLVEVEQWLERSRVDELVPSPTRRRV